MSTFDIGSPVWKRAAKKHRRRWFALIDDLMEENAAATRRLELLRRWNSQTHICVFCNGWLTWIGELGDEDKKGHADDCELAEELGDG